jgi:transcriptional regulator with GAF, ATPase, and Fis domain
VTTHHATEMRNARTSSDRSIDAGFARDLSELARTMQAESDSAAVLARVARAAVQEIDGADHAVVSLISKGHVSSEVPTSDVVSQVDLAQNRLGEGPCLTSLREQTTVRADDLRDEPRWPKFAKVAVAHGVLSMLCVQLYVAGDNLGALNLYAERPHAFTDADENMALLLASHAAVALVGVRKIGNLETALANRDVIGQAKGILMERYKISSTEAFSMMIAVSQHHHVKLAALAEQLATTGELPGLA